MVNLPHIFVVKINCKQLKLKAMKHLKKTTIILILVLVSLLSQVFAQKEVIHFKTFKNQFGKYDEKGDTSVFDIFNDSQVDVFITKNNIFLVDTGMGIIKLSALEFVKKVIINNIEYTYIKAEDQSDKKNIRVVSFGVAIDKKNNLGGIYLTDYKLSCYLNIKNTINNYDYTIENFIASLPKYDEAIIAKSP